ncbi:MAG: hypothetical protein QOE89_2259 [Pseudonocardiales bacterium]|nr:hypothetical protein [Pseudonocardiales bacterium]
MCSAVGQVALRRQLLEQASRLQRVTDDLGEANAELRRVSPVHEVLAAAAAGRDGSDSVQAIADALYRVTDLPVVVEDRFGTPRAWSGTSQPEPAHGRRAHAELLREAQRHATPIRDRDRVIAVSQPHEKVLGTIALLAPANTAAEKHYFALEHAALALSGELAHQHALAEVELRLRRDLVDDLLSGTDEKSACVRAQSVGHDLTRAHRVLAIGYPRRALDDQLLRAVERAAHKLGMPCRRRTALR